VGIDQVNHRLPRHLLLDLGQKPLARGALLSYCLLILTEPELFSDHASVLAWIRPSAGAEILAFPESLLCFGGQRSLVDVEAQDG
jgi:hypothetical protein